MGLTDPAGNPSDAVQVGKGDADEYGTGSDSSGSKGATKAELLADAKEKGLNVSDSNTKAEIQAALDEHAASGSGDES